MRHRISFALLFALPVLVTPRIGFAAGNSDQPGRHALFVACTRYPGLPIGMQLRGPGNDAALMKQLLRDRFGFPAGSIVTLSEEQKEEKHRPTRANIVREFQALIRRVRKGDRVVILLSGHGSQQPDNDPENKDDPEPDGLDELFLPSDIGDWDGSKQTVKNAIVDDEFRNWLTQIRNKGASVWFIADSCHSGTLSRGPAEDERSRQVPADILVPKKVLAAAEKKAHAIRGTARGAEGAESGDMPKGKGEFVALYAAQSNEPTYEKRLPKDAEDRKPYGLLTFAINRVLLKTSTPISYRELVHLVHQQYVAWGRAYPTPLVEGTGLDRQVLGQKNLGAARILLKRNLRGEFVIDAGALHGTRKGTVLKVFPPAGKKNAGKPLGHVQVKRGKTLESVVEPIAYAGMPAKTQLPNGARCQVVYRSYGDLQLAVAVKKTDLNGKALARQHYKRLTDLLKQLQQKKNSLVRYVDKAADAHWRLVVRGNKVLLLPPGGFLVRKTASSTGKLPLYGPAPIDDKLSSWLEERLQRIARVRNLRSLSTGAATISVGGMKLRLDLLRYDSEADRTPEVVFWDNGLTLREGDVIQFRVRNTGTTPVDVTLLFIDENYGITPFLPSSPIFPGIRIAPGKSATSPRARVTPTSGLEHTVLIGVRPKKQEQPANFGWLAQPSLEKARTTRGSRIAKSPLQKLFEASMYAAGSTRGLVTTGIDDHSIQLTSWRVAKKRRKKR